MFAVGFFFSFWSTPKFNVVVCMGVAISKNEKFPTFVRNFSYRRRSWVQALPWFETCPQGREAEVTGRKSRKGLYSGPFLSKAELWFFHFLEIVTGWLVSSAGQKILVQPGWYLPLQKIPLAQNRFLRAGKGDENTKEKSKQCFKFSQTFQPARYHRPKYKK